MKSLSIPRVIAGLFVLLLIAGCGPKDARVTRRDIIVQVPLTGQVAAPAVAEANILPPYAAQVAQVLVTVGQKVRKGDALMALAAPASAAYYQEAQTRLQSARSDLAQARAPYDAAVQQAKTNLQQAKAVEKQAQSGNGDLAAATSQRVAAEQAYADAVAKRNEALAPYEQQLASAQQEFADAQAGQNAAMIRTPITGTVLNVYVRSGDSVDPASKDPVARVVDLNALKVYAGADKNQSSQIQLGDPATITASDIPNTEFTGRVQQIYTQRAGLLQNANYVVVLGFDNSLGSAKPGMDAQASIVIDEAKNVLTVPASAVYQSGAQDMVKVRANGKWQPRAVDVGISDGTYTEIKSGLQEGDVVNTRP